jgi:enoyl-[acyl-carrier protein] reductase / trans-2-enoyl-CoA reductase (NAD+)
MKSIMKPKVRGFMCVSAHPEGCAANVKEQIDYVKKNTLTAAMPKRVLVIGSSTGYGLSSRITAAFSGGASTIGVFFEKEATGKRPASAGWYNSAAFHAHAEEEGLYAKSFNGDAFSNTMKSQVIETIKEDLGQIDLIIYSLGAPRRQHPVTGVVHSSTLKSLRSGMSQTTIDTDKKVVKECAIDVASQQEIDDTVAVMGGEDWLMWIEALNEAGVLAQGCKTTAYTYIGGETTQPIYWDGTIGEAKRDLDKKVLDIKKILSHHEGSAFVSVLKAVITQSSSAIPIMPMYLSLLIKVMEEHDCEEGCIEQIHGLFEHGLLNKTPSFDECSRFRVDVKELDPVIQNKVIELWSKITTETINELSRFDAYQSGFLKLFGFGNEDIDYELPIELDRPISSVIKVES